MSDPRTATAHGSGGAALEERRETGTTERGGHGRRALLVSAAAVATLAACKPSSPGGSPTPTASTSKSPGKPGTASPSVPAATSRPPDKPVARNEAQKIAHLIRRATYGPVPGLQEEVAKTGMKAWLDRQLDPDSIDDPERKRIQSWYPVLRTPREEIEAAMAAGDRTRQEYFQGSVHEFTALATWSRRQLLEIMTNLFVNHFNVARGNAHTYAHHTFVELIRTHCISGRFSDLLVATSKAPDMIAYLTLLRSTKENPNENYAREVMELHTVGVDGGYTEDDVRQGALLFTGWYGYVASPRFMAKHHHVGPLKIMGFRTENAVASKGPEVQEDFLRYLARHPKTAERLAHKIAVRFVSDNPPRALVARMAKAYLDNDTAIAPMLRVCLTSDEFFAAPSTSKQRRPFERLVASLRVFAPVCPKDGSGMAGLAQFNAAERPFGHATPDGYPDVAAEWTSPAAALEQFKAALALGHGTLPGLGLPLPGRLVPDPPRDPGALVNAVARRVLMRDATEVETRAGLKLLSTSQIGTSFEAGSPKQQQAVAALAALLTLTPSNLAR